MKFIDRVKQGFNVFASADKKRQEQPHHQHGRGSFYHPGSNVGIRATTSSRDITNSIYTRIAVDFANVDIKHVKLDANKRYSETVASGLNDCLSLDANIDQTGWALKQDIAHTLIENGTIAIVPVDTDADPEATDGVGIQTLRVGTITQWKPEHVMVRLYDERDGRVKEIELHKKTVAIVENPFHSTMNSPNSTLKRLTRKISLLDSVDEQLGSGKLDLIIQLPYIVKGDTKRAQAEKRRSELEAQLQSSQYGVAYADGTEKIVQLNRPVENNLMKNVEALTKLLYTELGITEEVLNGTASEEAMLNYNSRIIKPLLKSVVESMRRRFLSRTARTQGHSIEFFIDPFSLVPLSKLSDIADKLTRNAILSSNEMRPHFGYAPVEDEMADKLVNKNMPTPPESEPPLE